MIVNLSMYSSKTDMYLDINVEWWLFKFHSTFINSEHICVDVILFPEVNNTGVHIKYFIISIVESWNKLN